MPALVLHAAAWTDVDRAEEDEPGALRVNVEGIADLPGGLGAPVVYYSSDYVFDGSKREPYLESDEPAPLGAYGRSKLLGEREVTEGWVVRSLRGFSVGRAITSCGRCFGSAQSGTRYVVDDQRGCPTYVGHLAAATREPARLAGRHLAPRGRRRWTWADWPPKRSSRRPAWIAASCPSRRRSWAGRHRGRRTRCLLKSGRKGVPKLPHWREGLRECLARLGA